MVLKLLLRECEVLLQGADATYSEASVDIFCRVCQLRKVMLPPSVILMSSSRYGG